MTHKVHKRDVSFKYAYITCHNCLHVMVANPEVWMIRLLHVLRHELLHLEPRVMAEHKELVRGTPISVILFIYIYE